MLVTIRLTSCFLKDTRDNSTGYILRVAFLEEAKQLLGLIELTQLLAASDCTLIEDYCSLLYLAAFLGALDHLIVKQIYSHLIAFLLYFLELAVSVSITHC